MLKDRWNNLPSKCLIKFRNDNQCVRNNFSTFFWPNHRELVKVLLGKNVVDIADGNTRARGVRIAWFIVNWAKLFGIQAAYRQIST